jgi:hypothetical protein
MKDADTVIRRAPGLRALREARGLTRLQLAGQTGIPEHHLAALEGGWGWANYDQVLPILEALDAECSEVVFRIAFRDRFGHERWGGPAHSDDCEECGLTVVVRRR